MKLFFLIRSYFKFLFYSGNEHSIHSPFVFDVYTKAIKPSKKFYAFAAIELLREKMLGCKDIISVTDFGTDTHQNTSRVVKNIAKKSLKNPRLGQVLFQLVDYYQPTTIIDLGTSLGITTMYLASAKTTAKVTSFEGCVNIASYAQSNFKKKGLQNIELVVGNIDSTLRPTLEYITQVDFVFFDANHTYEATMLYFQLCLQKATTESVFVFDDIHWSPAMEAAWQAIKAHDQVTLSIDLFHVGIIFLRTNQPKQHFILRI